jgi:hypothetical protein
LLGHSACKTAIELVEMWSLSGAEMIVIRNSITPCVSHPEGIFLAITNCFPLAQTVIAIEEKQSQASNCILKLGFKIQHFFHRLIPKAFRNVAIYLAFNTQHSKLPKKSRHLLGYN